MDAPVYPLVLHKTWAWTPKPVMYFTDDFLWQLDRRLGYDPTQEFGFMLRYAPGAAIRNTTARATRANIMGITVIGDVYVRFSNNDPESDSPTGTWLWKLTDEHQEHPATGQSMLKAVWPD